MHTLIGIKQRMKEGAKTAKTATKKNKKKKLNECMNVTNYLPQIYHHRFTNLYTKFIRL